MQHCTVTSYQWQKEICDRFSDTGKPSLTHGGIFDRLYTLANFLQSNNLTNKDLFKSRDEIDESFSIHTSDLTDEGIALIRKIYDKWASGAKCSTDATILEKGLQKIRSEIENV